MKNFIPVKNYKKVESVTFGNLTDASSEGHTYYMGFDDPKDIILENLNPEGKYVYDRVINLCEMDGKVLPMMELIGIHTSSVFNKNYSGIDEFGFAEVGY